MARSFHSAACGCKRSEECGRAPSYTARTVAHEHRDRRDSVTDQIYTFVDAARTDPEKAPAIAKALVRFGPPRLPGWRAPSSLAQRLAVEAIEEAVPRVWAGAQSLGLSRVALASQSNPRPRLTFERDDSGETTLIAPLLGACVEPNVLHGLAQLLVYVNNPIAASLWASDIQGSLHARLNAHLVLESNLWWLAEVGGYDQPPPYAARYEAARWLWSPEIAGVVFCLRCGSTVTYKRAGRQETSGRHRRARCSKCSRSTPDQRWPSNAIAPAGRGTWWLHCSTKECPNPFVGRADTKRCPQHRLNRIAKTRRSPQSP